VSTLLEGVRAVALPCTLALLLPGLVVALAARLRAPAVLAFVGTVGVMVWATALGVDLPTGVGWRLLGAGTLGLGLVAVWRGRHPALRAAGGSLVAALSSVLWVPCVGRALGAALTSAPGDPLGQFLPLVLYGVGSMLPLLALVAVGVIVRSEERWPGWLDTGAAVVGLVLVAVLALGAWDEVVGELVRRSTI
jgi:hypothetical protein